MPGKVEHASRQQRPDHRGRATCQHAGQQAHPLSNSARWTWRNKRAWAQRAHQRKLARRASRVDASAASSTIKPRGQREQEERLRPWITWLTTPCT